MNIFNLKALGDKIRAVFNNKYNLLLNKIATKSKAYKQLYNDYNSILITNKYLGYIDATVHSTKTGRLIRFLVRGLPGSLSTLSGFDVSIIRMSEPNDILIVADDFEKFRVLEEMKHFSGSGQVFTLEELMKPDQKINVPIGKVYVFSSIWLKDLITLENMIYIIENEKEVVKL
jgi:fluoride ion exporter CrcB/FEX